MADRDPVVTLDEVTVTYGRQPALQEVTASFAAGAVGLLGPNGAGKSTMIKALLGFIVPDRGRMHVLGLDVAASPLEIRARVGYMPESDAHIPGMNAVSFVAYCGELSGLPRVDAILTQMFDRFPSITTSLACLAAMTVSALWWASRAVEDREYVLEQ